MCLQRKKGLITNSFFITGKIDAGLFFLLAAIGDGRGIEST